MRYIVRHTDWVTERVQCVAEMKRQIPNLEVVNDSTHNAMDTFLDAMLAAGNDACVHMEDDLRLCSHFTDKIERAIALADDMPMQFYASSKTITTTTLRAGSTFSSTVCFYLPKGMSKAVYDFYCNEWMHSKYYEMHPTGFDIVVNRFFCAHGLKYIYYCPCFVQHEPWTSVINPSRSKKRHSIMFKE